MDGKKITVKHYLNKRAKPREYKKELFYPLYIQIIVDAKKAQIKSRINEHLEIYQSEIDQMTGKNKELDQLILTGYFTEKQMGNVYKNETFPLFHLLSDEIDVIKRIIVLQKPFNSKNFTLQHFSYEYEKHVTEITDILDNHIKDKYRIKLNEIFLETVDKKDERRTFNISNYFIHYVNWKNTFSNYYQVTYEAIPSELKYIENYLDPSLLDSIKAYMAYHSKVNLVKRHMEKKEHGKISTVSYLDWIIEIKGLLGKEFLKIFGKKKAELYVDSLDKILEIEIHKK
ncbi:MAG: hypothetical protein ISS19_01605 [Bacteroidales bacterium]|nr:hypothetical protein [Bacteroidales bacterium]